VSSITTFEKYLLESEIVSQSTLETLPQDSRKHSKDLIQVLLNDGISNPLELYTSIARFCELPFIELTEVDISAELVAEVPARFVSHYQFVPVNLSGDRLEIALSNPLDSNLLDEIALVLGRSVSPLVATPDDIQKTIKKLYGLGADTVERIISESDKDAAELSLESEMATDLGDESIDASIIKFVNEVLMEAIQAEGTDIHIEPFEDELRVRYRIDGVMHGVPVPATIRGFQAAIASRVKVMANLNIAEKRLPQDGKIQASFGGNHYDLRVSVLPTPYGETLNIRILTRSSVFLSLADLGFMPDDLKQINRFIERPHGIILVTGPTGSGKSTTLYAALNKLNKMDRKTITIEDPIEYQMKGITQMQVLPQIGFDFSTGLRSMLRHDPDIMMVGEIRDYETAEMAIRASLTGHLVFSTLHTNDAPGTVTRLIDMGVEPFLIASTMIASVAQRLVRKVCESCAEPFTPSPEILKELHLTSEEISEATFRQGNGCEKCRNTGYRGRLAICEVMPFHQPIKELTVNAATSIAIKQKARELGMRTLRDSGWTRVKSGETTLDEVLRVTADTDSVYEE
jgi:type II secretion system protein E